ncbi:DNA circularization N-terminal domain-containing protein, partial [Algimonas porphyrae]
MSWRDQLEKASFRGVPFHVSRSGGEVGRRVQLTEYPLRDRPYAEDLGRKAR